ncbi:ABC transporter permease subunit [Lusitaniella coriacea LEGE 07157]|uniref:ABC transporter permease subunit n=1 Tax=Lusitaniella coriacea LEGE 07157 TaxID=945747 RepID=A0A8J7DX11_9CYAN|nr:ABC transporter permease subunit [Lusitaniella coriacea]MBE9116328.1 ABC transporter permease subunit [Lusitaniella coriacea LEGE 07157]
MIAISNIIAIFRKELQGYFTSPFAYIIVGVFWFLSGSFFISILLETSQEISLLEQQGTPYPIDAAYIFLLRFFSALGLLSLFILPILSMGLYAEERKRGTLELLATSPITNWSVAVGKLLGAIAFFTFMILPLLIYEAIAFGTADPPLQPGVPLLAHLGLILLAAAILSLGMFLSSLTDSTILAAILTFTLVLLLWIVDLLANRLPSPFSDILSHLSLLKHYNNLIQGVVDLSSLVLLMSYIILGLFLTAQSIEALRFARR